MPNVFAVPGTLFQALFASAGSKLPSPPLDSPFHYCLGRVFLSTVLTIGLVFFICFRECLECSIIVSVLLAFLKQTLGPEHDAAVRKRLVRQVWAGVGLGVLICLIICAGVIGTCESLAPIHLTLS